jgi:hypothetical protein
MQELGFPGFEATTWYGLVGPGKLPVAIQAQERRRQQGAGDARRAGEAGTYGAEDGGGSTEKFADFMKT